MKDANKQDWGAECAGLMEAIEKLHNVTVNVVLSTGRRGMNPTMRLGAIASVNGLPVVPAEGATNIVGTASVYPTVNAKELGIAIFQLLHKLDMEISRELYVQMRLED